ncbi:alpha/beta hydrolase [Nocardia cyriacigeorgica]|uniref:alpha/beta fold hydrolase n=1 Tax=Nocardia cyriacigeorgica TaxID=135487 RepID=UPI001893DF78|nr:alpha/beta hydrolase [Nocardia cyriacigeorgica]MBF6087565.1 alpha/beta hydrolase [Nocardia cyriacigeorgica]MBF6092505.1 alpha/beta hydrolase [Nocardia cyriacigeorgica]MBF6397081.1 alpha/beta hydrolase [Nocardia cyriacigeorgica]MBF6403261.1 alpha/beta hydrolase [Nocardia cyriacigeorgica]
MASNFLPDPSSVRYEGPWTHRDVHANGIRFHIVEAAPERTDAPLVLLLHGFADLWWSWRHQLTGLSDLGYRAVAVDLRGYGDSDKPPRGYDGWTLAGDIAGLIRALGHTEATLVGHADGGLVCWATAVMHPRLVRAIAVIGSPHPAALKSAVLRDRAQRSTWLPNFLRYQLPRYPEHLLTRGDGAEVERLLRERVGASWSGSSEFTDTARRMRSAIQIPGAAHCSLEYQRWAFRSQWRPDGRRFMAIMRKPIDIPVLSMRGEQDRYVLTATIHRGHRLSPRRTVVTIPDAGHFAHQENPEAVTTELAKLLG